MDNAPDYFKICIFHEFVVFFAYEDANYIHYHNLIVTNRSINFTVY